MKKMPKEQYPTIFVTIISIINIALTAFLGYGSLFAISYSRGSIDYTAIALAILPIVMLILFFIYLKKLSKQLINREITQNRFTNMLILSPFLMAFLSFSSCILIGSL